MKTNIKQTNKLQILDFFGANNYKTIDGNKLKALYKLIQLKGEEITGDNIYKGLKALEVENGQFVAIKKTVFNNKQTSFFPCKMENVLLQTI